MDHGDHAASADLSREGDGPGCGGPYLGAVGGGHVHPPVPARPGQRRRVEAAQYGDPPRDRPGPSRSPRRDPAARPSPATRTSPTARPDRTADRTTARTRSGRHRKRAEQQPR
ncbi:hypothetical protein ACIQGZ_07750 [Streptomyces sp. NPDC092296]|uniref:hypothetical protein n=1 Tax=Streptomyces sp. NPDC092296 TaxID=3366012 RepID=UPI0038065394